MACQTKAIFSCFLGFSFCQLTLVQLVDPSNSSIYRVPVARSKTLPTETDCARTDYSLLDFQ